MVHRFVPVNEFTPNNGDWRTIGPISGHARDHNTFRLHLADPAWAVQITVLGPTALRVRFLPVANPDYSQERSFAVVERNLGNVNLTVTDNADHLLLDTGQMQVRVDLQPYRLCIYRNGQLICADEPSYNLVYIPGQEVIANFKTYPANARYCGLGERAGAYLFKNQTTTTFFNFDNYAYSQYADRGDPRDPAMPLYCSIPFLIEMNPQPVGAFAGAPYCYGILLDNPAQSYVNIGYTDYGHSMYGRYYFGALYGEMDYYLMVGSDCRDVLRQYTTLTGRAHMPPKYAFGFHQGGYGYYDRAKLLEVANGYRNARIPIDGLHIDIDFQNDYRVFTHSEIKFPAPQALINALHAQGYKCSTNVSPFLLAEQDIDETGQVVPYVPRQAVAAIGGLIPDELESGPVSPGPYAGTVGYGAVENPYRPPYRHPNPNNPNAYDVVLRAAFPDICRADVRRVWGDQYRHLVQDLQLDMIWQDMMCPAVNQFQGATKTLDLYLMQDRGDGVRVPHAKIHNHYALNLAQGTWEGLGRLRRQAGMNVRDFIIARGGFAGVQRYAAIWTGDSPSDRRYLACLVPQVLNMGLSGVPISGSDVGGFSTGLDSVEDASRPHRHHVTHYVVFVRWLQASAFLPWFRNHYPAYDKEFQEVYRYGEPVPTICRQIIDLRYRLLPMFYDAMYEWTQTGTPVCRPLFLNDAGDPGAYDNDRVNDQFFVGDDLLIAPIVPALDASGLSEYAERPVYLPAGSQWFAFKDNQAPLETPVPAGTSVPAWRARLGQVPIYVRAGAILPMHRDGQQYVGELPTNPLVINVYPGPDGSHRLYLDDGISLDAASADAYRLTEVRHTNVPGARRVRVRRLFDQYRPPEPYYLIAFLGTRQPTSVRRDISSLPDAGSWGNLASAAADAFCWVAATETTFVKLFDQQADVTVEVVASSTV